MTANAINKSLTITRSRLVAKAIKLENDYKAKVEPIEAQIKQIDAMLEITEAPAKPIARL